uniref:Uncharacterized protein n=1 Tax=Anguilla anguilla TaxID=7936 RepID=A0A0E9TDI5_ANGAN
MNLNTTSLQLFLPYSCDKPVYYNLLISFPYIHNRLRPRISLRESVPPLQSSDRQPLDTVGRKFRHFGFTVATAISFTSKKAPL